LALAIRAIEVYVKQGRRTPHNISPKALPAFALSGCCGFCLSDESKNADGNLNELVMDQRFFPYGPEHQNHIVSAEMF